MIENDIKIPNEDLLENLLDMSNQFCEEMVTVKFVEELGLPDAHVPVSHDGMIRGNFNPGGFMRSLVEVMTVSQDDDIEFKKQLIANELGKQLLVGVEISLEEVAAIVKHYL